MLNALGPHASHGVASCAQVAQQPEGFGCVGHRVRTYQMRTSSEPEKVLWLTQLSATNLPPKAKGSKGEAAGGPILEATVSNKGLGVEHKESTLAGQHLVNPIWSNECLALPLDEKGSNITVELAVISAGERIGFARFTVIHAVGRFDGELMGANGAPSGATVSVFYQAPAWGDVFADPSAAHVPASAPASAPAPAPAIG